MTIALVGGANAQNAQLFTVPGTADPWLANATVDYNADIGYLDTAPGESPVFAGDVTGGDTLSWTATGAVGSYPGDYWGGGPDGNGVETTRAWGNNGIQNIVAPDDALLGLFTGSSSFSDQVPFIMGSSGQTTVPDGATEFFTGVMHSALWNIGQGSFQVNLEISPVPEPSTIALVVSGLAALATIRCRINQR
jgi:hypothetical protein